MGHEVLWAKCFSPKVTALILIALGRKAWGCTSRLFSGLLGPADPPSRPALKAEAAQLAEKPGQWLSSRGSAALIQDGLGLLVQNSPIS